MNVKLEYIQGYLNIVGKPETLRVSIFNCKENYNVLLENYLELINFFITIFVWNNRSFWYRLYQ